MKTPPKQKFYHLSNSFENEFYSLINVGGKVTFLKTMKRKRFALLYSLAQAKEYKAWLIKNELIYSIIIPK